MDDIPLSIQIHIRKLTMIEEMLLAPVFPMMTVCKLSSGANVSRGYVANFRHESQTFIKQIPLAAAQLPCLVIRRPGQNNTFTDFKVNRERIAAVGRWLVENHPGFIKESVTFSQENCDALPEDGILEGVAELLLEENDDAPLDEGPQARQQEDGDGQLPEQASEHVYVDQAPIRRPQHQEIHDIISAENDDTVPWPAMDPKPINEFEVSGLASLAFVKLFPKGQADPTSKGRLHSVSPLLAAGHLLKYAEIDPSRVPDEEHPHGFLYYPFAEHERFAFYMVDLLRRHRALGQIRIYLKRHPEDGVLSLEDLKRKYANGEIDDLQGRLYSYAANVVGSHPYWYQKGRELEAVMQQKGFGTAFFTFSFADNHWHDLHRLMPNGLVDPKKRYRNIVLNPHLADWWFSERLSSFIRHFFKGALDAVWTWLRYEWQSRTAIHAHGVVKLRNDPGIVDLVTKVYASRLLEAKLEDPDFVAKHTEQQLSAFRSSITEGREAEDRVIQYVNWLLTAVNVRDDPINPANAVVPNPHPCSTDISLLLADQEKMDQHYLELSNCVQRHVCRPTGYCKLKKKTTGSTSCRFGYPKPNAEVTTIEFQSIGSSGQVKATLNLKRNDQFMNPHNRTMLEHWGANVDLQIILDAHAAMTYMVKYASKPESSGNQCMSTLRTIVNHAREDASSASILRSAMLRSISQRDIGQGECSRILFSGHHCESSFSYVIVSLELDVQEVTRTTTNPSLIPNSIVMCYASRHQLVPLYPDLNLLQPNLIEFCRQFKLIKGQIVANRDPDKVVVITFPSVKRTQNTAQYVRYCRMQLIKYKPWSKTDMGLLLQDNEVVPLWEDFEKNCAADLRRYFAFDVELQKRLQEAAHAIEQLEQNDEEEHQPLNQLQWQVAAGMGPPEQAPALLMTPVITPNFDWHHGVRLQYTPTQLKKAATWVTDNLVASNGTAQRVLPSVDREQLNEKQRKWFDLVLHSVQEREQLLLIVNGTAGTGKTHTISAISSALPQERLIRCAFTAKAAFLIRGSTLHSTFNIPVQNSGSKQFGPFNGRALRDLQAKFKDVEVIIIDEYSMLSQVMLGKIECRLREAKCNDLPFGGVSIILVGDPAQLPPVAAPALYSSSKLPYAVEGLAAYKAFTKVIVLNQVCRQVVQAGDKEQQIFVDALSSIRNGTFEKEQWRLLRTRSIERIPDFNTVFKGAIRLFATNEKVNEFNAYKLQELGLPVTCLKSVNFPQSAKSASSDNFRGFENEIFLAIGAEVTLISNINSADGLTNGTLGTVKDIVYAEGKRPNVDLPDFVVVHFANYDGAQFFEEEEYRNYVPIGAIEVQSDDFRQTRTQFPFRLAYAITIHKSQRDTLDLAVVDLGPKEMTPGLSFVALSRVRHIRNLAVAEFPYDRLSNLSKSAGFQARLKEEQRLNELAAALEN